MTREEWDKLTDEEKWEKYQTAISLIDSLDDQILELGEMD